MTTLRRNAVASLVSRVITAVMWLAATPYVLVHLGAERFGIWSLFFAFLGYLTAFDLGLNSTMTRFVASARGSAAGTGLRRTLRRGFGMSLGLGAFWALVVVLSRGWIVSAFRVPAPMVPETLEALLVFAVAVLLVFPALAMMGALQGFERLDLSNTCLVVGVTAHTAVLCAGLAAGGGLKAAALGGVVGQGVALVLAGWMLRAQLRQVESTGTNTAPKWRDLMNFGVALQLAGLLLAIQFQSGKVLLGLLGDLPKVSDFELAFRVTSAVGGLPVLLMLSVIPTVSRAKETAGPAAIAMLFTSTSRWVYTVTAIVMGMLWLLAPDIARVWLGPEHVRIAPLIRAWAITYSLILGWGPGTVVARGIGIPWWEVRGLAVSLIVNLALAAWWIPRYGTVGAIAALGVSFVPAFVLFVAGFHRDTGIPFWPWFGREFLGRVLAGVLTVVLCTQLLAVGSNVGYLPSPGWAHGAAAVSLFMVVFSILFAPLGDTQRLFRTLWHLTAGLWAWSRRAQTS